MSHRKANNSTATNFADVSEDYIKKYKIDLSAYDVIIGYRADDSYFAYAQGFFTGQFPLEFVNEALRLGDLGLQVCLK